MMIDADRLFELRRVHLITSSCSTAIGLGELV
jgi:hypothetical protein